MKGTQHSTLADIPCDCDNDPIGCLRHMFVDVVQRGRIEKGQCPAKRPVFLRLHGVAAGRLEVVPGLPEAYRVGIFSGPASYPAWVRFSSDIPDGYPDLKTTVGLGVKLFDVAGEKMLPLDKHAPTADFVFQNHDVFFVKNARDMCSFTKASMAGKEEYDKWIEENPETDIVLKAMEKRVPSALTESFWSVIPFRFGMGRYCKYKIEPELDSVWPEPNYEDPTYLKTDMERRLSSGEVRYRFLVQMRLNPESMPLDNAMARWDEKLSPPQQVATLILPKQDITARGQAAYGEELAFNPWRTLKEHEPVESLAEARKVIYQASAELRHNVNGQPRGEPEVPRPETVWPAGKDSVIVRAAIHPGIGIARVGNSKASDGFYIGPEVIEPMPAKASDMRDSNGALKRQAARFRIYGYNAAGEVVGELTSDTATITWQVHLANRKAQWYQFQNALDIPEAAEDAFPLRNADIKGAARSGLAIDPGARSIAGKETSGVEYQFNTGEFQGTVVDLGELRTDPTGRLLVLGGYGVSASPAGKPIYDPAKPGSFNNANGWYDDTSDGPVTATVSIAGRDVPVDSAWVVVAPPNFAPDIVGWRTLYDQLTDVYVEGGGLPFPEMASFARDVLPALSRLNNLQWVNKGFATMFGQGGQFNFSDPTLIAKLAHRPSSGEPDTYEELRRVVFNAFRPADTQVNEPRTWPWLYGDAYGSFDHSPKDDLALSDVRSRLLQLWVEGKFENDWNADYEPPRLLSQVDLSEQPAMLDQAALHFCLADAFHPGCELTWPMRHGSLYRAPFRIRERPANDPVPEYGSKLTQKIVMEPGGPLYGQQPGDLSRWMALPWQGDTVFCRSGYDPEYDPYIPSFWPARVPNQVLTEADYATVMDSSLPREERIAAFNNRLSWLRGFSGSGPQQMLQMVSEFGEMGLVEAKPGEQNDPDIPPTIFVESLKSGKELPTLLELDASVVPGSAEHRLRKAGWQSKEQLEEFRRIVSRKDVP